MPPKKPVIFFSHSSHDARMLTRLKEAFDAKTAGAIEVFLSSDGQSIRFGTNWVHRVQEALDEARIMFAFLSPEALRSNWLYFEAGHAYSKGIRVVPVAILGLDLGSLKPPMSLLQGFNVSSKDGLNNIIAVVNDEFHFKCRETFTVEEYQAIFLEGLVGNTAGLTGLRHIVEEITFSIASKNGLESPAGVLIPKLGALIKEAFPASHIAEHSIEAPGISLNVMRQGGTPEPIQCRVDPVTFEHHYVIVSKLVHAATKQGFRSLDLRFELNDQVGVITEIHRVSARLPNSGLSYAESGELEFGGVEFSLRPGTGRFGPLVRMKSHDSEFPVNRAVSLLHALIDHGVILEPSDPW